MAASSEGPELGAGSRCWLRRALGGDRADGGGVALRQGTRRRRTCSSVARRCRPRPVWDVQGEGVDRGAVPGQTPQDGHRWERGELLQDLARRWAKSTGGPSSMSGRRHARRARPDVRHRPGPGVFREPRRRRGRPRPRRWWTIPARVRPGRSNTATEVRPRRVGPRSARIRRACVVRPGAPWAVPAPQAGHGRPADLAPGGTAPGSRARAAAERPGPGRALRRRRGRPLQEFAVVTAGRAPCPPSCPRHPVPITEQACGFGAELGENGNGSAESPVTPEPRVRGRRRLWA